jgi:hypothetical protein
MALTNLSSIYGSGDGGIDTGGGGGGGGGIDIIEVHNRWRVEYFTIGVADISNKYIVVSAEPKTASKVKLEVVHGPTCDYSIDYGVTPATNTLFWNGLGLDGSLAVGDKLRVTYFEV